jgi:hypothetical protein
VIRWEYRVVQYQPESAAGPAEWQFLEPFSGGYMVIRKDFQLAPMLVFAGEEGWELAAIDRASSGQTSTFYFKRSR